VASAMLPARSYTRTLTVWMPIESGGEVTSGTHSPMIDRGIGMGYVTAASSAPGSELVIDVRGKPKRARVVEKPIYRKET